LFHKKGKENKIKEKKEDNDNKDMHKRKAKELEQLSS